MITRVLVLDDAPDTCERVRGLLPASVDVVCIQDREALRTAVRAGAHLLLTERAVAWGDWQAVLHEAHEAAPALPVVLLTGTGDERLAVRALRAGAADYLRKNLPDHALQPALRRLLAAQSGRSVLEAVPVGEVSPAAGHADAPPPDDSACTRETTMVRMVRQADEHALFYQAIVHDITERERRRHELTRQAAALDQLPSGAIGLDDRLRVTYWNRRAEELYGYAAADALGRSILELVVPPENLPFLDVMEEQLASEDRVGFESDDLRADGSRVLLQKWITAVRDEAGRRIGSIEVVDDMEELRQRERQLTQALADRDALIREVHHRVKNSLQVVSSLLSVQARQAGAPALRRLVDQCQARIRAIAAAHEVLYEAPAHGTLDLRRYMEQVVARLWPAERRATIAVGHVAPVRVDVDLSVSLALIVVDLVLGTLEHADRRRRVDITVALEGPMALTRTETPHYELVVRASTGRVQALSGLAEVLVEQIRGVPAPGVRDDGELRIHFSPAPTELIA
ncbi:MAG: PAS domain S-box protein [Acidobacteria bacterium]|nr:PAS domain S-box protein [Acidobacteriota bacterium]